MVGILFNFAVYIYIRQSLEPQKVTYKHTHTQIFFLVKREKYFSTYLSHYIWIIKHMTNLWISLYQLLHLWIGHNQLPHQVRV